MRATKKRKVKSLKKKLDDLWSKCIKAKAGYKSELSGSTGKLHSHHIVGKPNYRLRYDLDNGICLTAGEHFYGIHNQGRQKDFEERIKNVKGKDIYDRLSLLKNQVSKGDLKLIHIYLKQKLKELENKLKKELG